MSRVMPRCTELAFIIGAAFTLFDGAQAACTLQGIDECIRDDPETAAELLEREVADTENVSLIFKAGVLFRYAREPIRDEARAAEYFERAAKLGEPWASYMLAKMIIGGKATGSPERVISLLTEAKTKGLSVAALTLGKFYRNQGDFEAALSELEAAADGGARAMMILADMLLKGEGTTADPERAISLLKQAAEAGLKGPAFKALGDYYLGIGNHEEAVVAFEQAAEAGDGWAKVALAGLLIEGEGTGADPEKARELLQSALEQDGISHAYIGLIELAAAEFPKNDALELGLSLLRDAHALDPAIALNSFEGLQPSDKTAILQAILLGEKLYLGPIDGIWGRNTMRAIGTFCSENALAECISDRTSVALLSALFNRLRQRPPDMVLVPSEPNPSNQSIEQNLPQPEPRAVSRRRSAGSSEESLTTLAPSAETPPALLLPPALLPTRPPRAGAGPAS